MKCHNLMEMALGAPIRRRVGPAVESHHRGPRVAADVLIAGAAPLRNVQWSHEMEKSQLSITNLDGEFDNPSFFFLAFQNKNRTSKKDKYSFNYTVL